MRWVWVSFGLAPAAALTLLFAPLGTSVAPVPGGSGRPNEVIAHPSQLEVDGWDAAIPLAVPVLIAAIPLSVRGRWKRSVRVATAVLLGAFVIAGILSVGQFYLPATVAMIVAGSSERRLQVETP